MPIFQDSKFEFEMVPEGDYIVAVSDFSMEISNGPNTKNAEQYNLIFIVEGTESKIRDTLYDHKKSLWRIEDFLRASGIRTLKKGQPWHFIEAIAKAKGYVWVNPMGLRCPVQILHESYFSTKQNKQVEKCVIKKYYTDREPLPVDPELRKKNPGSDSDDGPEGTPF